MKKKIALLISLVMILSCGLLAACGGNSTEAPAEEPATTEETTEDANVDPVDGSLYGYTGTDPAVAAVYQYVVEEFSKGYEVPDGGVVIPTVQIFAAEEGEEDEVLVSGNFCVDVYSVDGDVLKSTAGGSYPGKIHLIPVGSGYSGISFDAVEDGTNFEQSAKELFGINYDTFMTLYSDDEARAAARTETVSNFVKANGLAVTKYQDEGWDPVDLAL